MLSSLAHLEHWIFRRRMVLLALAMIGVVVALMFLGKPIDCGALALIITVLFKWIDGRGKQRARDPDFDRSNTADVTAARGGSGVPINELPPITDLFEKHEKKD